jgi:hypothetical protein
MENISTTSTLASEREFAVLWRRYLCASRDNNSALYRYLHNFCLDFELDLCLVEMVELVEVFSDYL